MAKRHTLPAFLAKPITQEAYERWLVRKANAHVRRDRKRNHVCGAAAYRDAIHQAVIESGGNDHYTGEALDWHLISTYRNEDSEQGRHAYKEKFARLPTVDHVQADSRSASFRICSWRTNDAKNDMSTQAFIDLCRKVLEHSGYRVSRR